VLVDGSGLSGPSGLSGEMADRYLRKSAFICGSSVLSSRPFAVLAFASLRLCVRFLGFAAEYRCGKRAVA
jgi:hypothetical protein